MIVSANEEPNRQQKLVKASAYAHTLGGLALVDVMTLLSFNNAKPFIPPGEMPAMGPLKGVDAIDMTSMLVGSYVAPVLGEYATDVAAHDPATD